MGNDPSQWSKVAERALEDIEAELHEIPARSPDINIIESIIYLLSVDLEDKAICENTTSDTFEQFRDYAFRSLKGLPVELTDRTIENMNNRIDAIIYSKGYWTKYQELCPGIGNHQFLFFIYEIMLRNTYSALAVLA